MKPLLTPPTPIQTRRPYHRTGFTLVELLTVIAIIAILTAIILPVFGLVRENTRRAASQSNMQQIVTGLKQYELDNRRYPDYLYGPAIKSNGSGGCATGTGAANGLLVMAGAGETPCTMEQAAQSGKMGGSFAKPGGTAKSELYGALYPEYVKDLAVFHSPNNTIADVTTDTQIATVTRLVPKTKNGATETVSYYKYDSYDANQALKTDGSPNPSVWQVRYTRQWVSLVDPPNPPDPSATFNQPEYKNQLIFAAPSTDTAVSMDTYSAGKGKVIILWLSNQAKVVDTNKLKNNAGLAGTSGRDFDYFKLGPNQ